MTCHKKHKERQHRKKERARIGSLFPRTSRKLVKLISSRKSRKKVMQKLFRKKQQKFQQKRFNRKRSRRSRMIQKRYSVMEKHLWQKQARFFRMLLRSLLQE